LAHRLTELAVANHIDTDRLLQTYKLLDRLSELERILLLVDELSRSSALVELQQVVGPRQAPRVARQDPIVAPSHALLLQLLIYLRDGPDSL
jgi:hypothetical protein